MGKTLDNHIAQDKHEEMGMFNRTVEVALSEGFVENTDFPHDTNISQAIGYLSTWAISSIERYAGKVVITGRDNGNISAQYHDSKGFASYNIFAQRREDGTYSFHS